MIKSLVKLGMLATKISFCDSLECQLGRMGQPLLVVLRGPLERCIYIM